MVYFFDSLPAFCEPLFIGLIGGAAAAYGSMLRSDTKTLTCRIGKGLCVSGLILMGIGFLCITSNLSILALAKDW